MSIRNNHSFYGDNSPLGGLTGAGILIMGSARLSWAFAITGCLLWVYALTSITFTLLLSAAGHKILPVKGRTAVYVCLSSFWGSLYIFIFWLLSPLAALELFFILLLVPLYYAVSGIAEQIPSFLDNANIDRFDSVQDALSQAGVLCILLIAFSILREPLSYCCLTFPGTYQGMITIMYFSSNSFFPIGIFSASAGALLLLGLIVNLYQFGRNSIFPGEKL